MSHWYDKEGKPQHFIKGANGVERDSTLRDARKHGWYPSVTEIIKTAAAPGLEIWKQNQVLYAALTLPRPEGISDDEFLKLVRQDAAQQASEAAERGNDIHKCMEAMWKEEITDTSKVDRDLFDICSDTNEAIAEYCQTDNFIPEATVVNPVGYGGMVDLSNPYFVIDYKGKSITDAQWDSYCNGKNPRLAYPEHAMQLVAYDKALGGENQRRGINVFVDREEPGRVIMHEWSADELNLAWEKFKCLCSYWRMTKNYYPGRNDE